MYGGGPSGETPQTGGLTRGLSDHERPSVRLVEFAHTTQGAFMSMADRDGKIWMDGKLIEWRDAKIHVLTHTLHYGMGVFEGVRAYKTPAGTAIFRLHEHTRRLFNSAKIFQMVMPFDEATLEAA